MVSLSVYTSTSISVLISSKWTLAEATLCVIVLSCSTSCLETCKSYANCLFSIVKY